MLKIDFLPHFLPSRHRALVSAAQPAGCDHPPRILSAPLWCLAADGLARPPPRAAPPARLHGGYFRQGLIPLPVGLRDIRVSLLARRQCPGFSLVHGSLLQQPQLSGEQLRQLCRQMRGLFSALLTLPGT